MNKTTTTPSLLTTRCEHLSLTNAPYCGEITIAIAVLVCCISGGVLLLAVKYRCCCGGSSRAEKRASFRDHRETSAGGLALLDPEDGSGSFMYEGASSPNRVRGGKLSTSTGITLDDSIGDPSANEWRALLLAADDALSASVPSESTTDHSTGNMSGGGSPGWEALAKGSTSLAGIPLGSSYTPHTPSPFSRLSAVYRSSSSKASHRRADSLLQAPLSASSSHTRPQSRSGARAIAARSESSSTATADTWMADDRVNPRSRNSSACFTPQRRSKRNTQATDSPRALGGDEENENTSSHVQNSQEQSIGALALSCASTPRTGCSRYRDQSPRTPRHRSVDSFGFSQEGDGMEDTSGTWDISMDAEDPLCATVLAQLAARRSRVVRRHATEVLTPGSAAGRIRPSSARKVKVQEREKSTMSTATEKQAEEVVAAPPLLFQERDFDGFFSRIIAQTKQETRAALSNEAAYTYS